MWCMENWMALIIHWSPFVYHGRWRFESCNRGRRCLGGLPRDSILCGSATADRGGREGNGWDTKWTPDRNITRVYFTVTRVGDWVNSIPIQEVNWNSNTDYWTINLLGTVNRVLQSLFYFQVKTAVLQISAAIRLCDLSPSTTQASLLKMMEDIKEPPTPTPL